MLANGLVRLFGVFFKSRDKNLDSGSRLRLRRDGPTLRTVEGAPECMNILRNPTNHKKSVTNLFCNALLKLAERVTSVACVSNISAPEFSHASSSVFYDC